MVEDGGGATDLHRLEVPPRQPRAVFHHQLDLLPVRDADARWIRHRRARRGKRESLLEQPRHSDQDDVREDETECDAEDEHRENMYGRGMPRPYTALRHCTRRPYRESYVP